MTRGARMQFARTIRRRREAAAAAQGLIYSPGVRGFLLPSGQAAYLVGVKVIALCGGYVYVWVLGLTPHHGPPWVFWLSLLLLVSANAILFRHFTAQPEVQEKQLLGSLGLDMLAIVYLFLMHPQAQMLMLVGLCLVSGFYTFVLPRSGGVLVGLLSMLAFMFSVAIAYYNPANRRLSASEVVAALSAGACALAATVLLARRMRKTVDAIYSTTDELALDLATHAVDGEIMVASLVERNREVQTMMQVLENIVSVLDWDELFENIIRAFRNRFQFDKFCIYLMDEETGNLELRVDSGADRATGVATSVKPDQGVVGWCYSTGKGVLIDDVKKDPRYAQFNERGKRIHSLACQPLIFRGDRLGVLCLDSERPANFDAKSFAFLESLVPLISITVSNSLSYTMVKAESTTDNLTSLHNHRGFMEKLPSLLELAFRDGVPTALLMLDIDDFKRVNDTYGHLVGNLILTELAEILTSFFRGSDVVARYGGEEFVVVLNGTPPDIAPRIAEQLRRKVDSHQFPISLQRDAFKQVTISIGLAACTDTNLRPELVRGSRSRAESDIFLRNVDELGALLIDNADQALYAAKREGKNQVMLSPFFPPRPPSLSAGGADPEFE